MFTQKSSRHAASNSILAGHNTTESSIQDPIAKSVHNALSLKAEYRSEDDLRAIFPIVSHSHGYIGKLRNMYVTYNLCLLRTWTNVLFQASTYWPFQQLSCPSLCKSSFSRFVVIRQVHTVGDTS